MSKIWEAHSIRENINKLDFIFENFCIAKDSIKRMKRQSTDWEKIFANYLSDRGPVSGIYNEM